jgi:hypothetical protein
MVSGGWLLRCLRGVSWLAGTITKWGRERAHEWGGRGWVWTTRRVIDKVCSLHLVYADVLTCLEEQLRRLADACVLIFKDLLEIAPSMKDVSHTLASLFLC